MSNAANEAERPPKPLIVIYAADLSGAQRAVEQTGGNLLGRAAIPLY